MNFIRSLTAFALIRFGVITLGPNDILVVTAPVGAPDDWMIRTYRTIKNSFGVNCIVVKAGTTLSKIARSDLEEILA